MVSLIQPSFAKGEISPALHGRVDTAAYQVALATAVNVVIRAYGGAENRPGSDWIGPVKDHSYAPRLIPFKFKTTDQYMLEFGDAYMRVMRNGAHVLNPTNNITGATQASPVVVTSASHSYSSGQDVYINGVVGMTELNDRYFRIGATTTNTFELLRQSDGADIDGQAYGAYVSGGSCATMYEIPTVYAIADVPEIKYTQSADVMTLTHPSYPTKELLRFGHASWSFTGITFAPEQEMPTGLAITVNTLGAVTDRYRVTAIGEGTDEESLPGLNTSAAAAISSTTAASPVEVTTSAGHGFATGDEIYISGVSDMNEINGRIFNITVTSATKFTLDGEDGSNYSAGLLGFARPTFLKVTNSAATKDNTITWNSAPNARKYAVYREKNGIFGLIGETEKRTFTDTNFAPDLSITPPKSRNPFVAVDAYPGATSYYQQRRVLGGSSNKPDTSHYSVPGNHKNFTVSSPTQADDAITATLSSAEVNDIRHYVPLSDLIVLTSGSEWRVNSGPDSGFQPDTLKQKPQSYWGSSHLRPIVAGSTIVFVDPSKTTVRTLGYSYQLDGYTGTNLTLLAGHIFETYSMVDWAWMQAPETYAACVRSDGYMATMTLNQEQEVIAWARWRTKGLYERVASLRNDASATEDGLYVVTKRIIGGRVERNIERFHSRKFTDVRDCFFVDCGASYDAPVDITGVATANPIVITAAAHGFSDGDQVDISDIIWDADFDPDTFEEAQPDQLNDRRYYVVNKTTNTFEISLTSGGPSVDGSAYNTYFSGGRVRKAKSVIGGLWHLEGQQDLVALCDGNVYADLTVTNGQVELPRAFSRVHIGFRYVADLETLNVEIPSRSGTIQGKMKNISNVTIRFDKSRGLLVGPNSLMLNEMRQREFENLGEPTRLLTGDKRIDLQPDWNSKGRIFMRQKDPLPMTILAVVPDVEIGG